MTHIEESPITLDEMLRRARSRLSRVSPSDLEKAAQDGAVIVDVRTAEQRESDGELPGAMLIDYTVLEWRLAPSSRHRQPDVSPDQQIILVCSQGYSSSLAAARLKDLGLSNATDLEGGYRAWKEWSNARG